MVDSTLPSGGRFVNDQLVNLFQDRIRQLIADLGRNVQFSLVPLELDCPNCGWDYVNQRSNNVYTPNSSGTALNKSFPTGTRCPVCGGKGKLTYKRTENYKALIGFLPPPEEVVREVQGVVPDNVFRTKTTLNTFENVRLAKFAVIDGVECERLTLPRKTGLRDLAFVLTYWKARNA